MDNDQFNPNPQPGTVTDQSTVTVPVPNTSTLVQPPTEPIPVQEATETKRMPVAGFNVHPENINRNGRPRRNWTWKDLLEEAVEESVHSKDGTRCKFKKLIAKKLLALGASGDIHAIKEIMDRMDGKPAQPVEGSGTFTLIIDEALKR